MNKVRIKNKLPHNNYYTYTKDIYAYLRLYKFINSEKERKLSKCKQIPIRTQSFRCTTFSNQSWQQCSVFTKIKFAICKRHTRISPASSSLAPTNKCNEVEVLLNILAAVMASGYCCRFTVALYRFAFTGHRCCDQASRSVSQRCIRVHLIFKQK